MSIQWLDHINIRTANEPAMADFYRKILGLTDGYRPPFGMGGTWLYCNDRAVVHLVTMDKPMDVGEPQMEHVAFMCKGLNAYLEKLRANDIPYWVSIVPEINVRQVNHYDPDGNHLEIQFTPDDDPDADISPFRMPEQAA